MVVVGAGDVLNFQRRADGLLVVCILSRYGCVDIITIRAFADGLIWPLGIDCVVIDILLISLIFGWYTENPKLGKLAGLCNIAIGAISFFLLYPHVLG